MFDEITTEWLTDVLSQQYGRERVAVKDVTIQLVKTLSYSTVARLKVEYSNLDCSFPNDFFIKITPGSNNDAHTMHIGKSEVEFYSYVGKAMSCPPLVRCFGTAYDVDTGRSHILMEDLSSTHSQPEQDQPPSEELTVIAVEALAKAHTVWWNSTELGHTVGKLFDREMLNRFIKDLDTSVSGFIDRSGVDLTSFQHEAYRLMLKNASRIWGRLMDPTNLTVTHGDCHWWNLLYPNDLFADTVRIFDWHLWHVDLGARDLAFFLALGGYAEPRPGLEERLLKSYCNTLISNGVSNYSFGQLLVDYRWSAIRNLNIPVIFWSQGKHDTTWRSALMRATASFDRLQCLELLLDS